MPRMRPSLRHVEVFFDGAGTIYIQTPWTIHAIDRPEQAADDVLAILQGETDPRDWDEYETTRIEDDNDDPEMSHYSLGKIMREIAKGSFDPEEDEHNYSGGAEIGFFDALRNRGTWRLYMGRMGTTRKGNKSKWTRHHAYWDGWHKAIYDDEFSRSHENCLKRCRSKADAIAWLDRFVIDRVQIEEARNA